MKIKFLSSRPQSRQAGSALLIILGVVALLTILVISFFVSARTEYSTSSFYSKGVNTKLLSENVINLVMAQLREGARSSDINNPGAPVAWASQPGMIRTYDNMGNPYKYFKLYSWDNMVGTGLFDETLTAEMPQTGWSTQPNVYTDLNEPVNSIYPIIDPSALGSVEGFSYSAAPDVTSTSADQLPMPVKWLYVMKNGSVSVGTTTTGTAVSVSGANANNPIIGRVAFWTDDETSKVNINTASEGTFWDSPIGSNLQEHGILGSITQAQTDAAGSVGYAEALPAALEFQATPGHPATTSLSTVFGYGTLPPLPDTSLYNTSIKYPLLPGSTGTYETYFSPYFALTPRYQSGGTLGGSLVTPTTTFNSVGYRLYDSVDELAFDPYRIALTSADGGLYPTSGGAVPSGRAALAARTGYSALTPQIIEQRRFFLTAHSRAPEETLFGTPRISLWPLQAKTADAIQPRTAKDNLLAFCSSINNAPYYFQRSTYFQYQATSGSSTVTSTDPNGTPANTIPFASSESATQDFSGVAGTVGAPTPAGATAPKTGVTRNEDLYAYLQALTGGNNPNGGPTIPGFGGNFLNKYPGGTSSAGYAVTDRDEILTEMFDFLRSGVNTFNVDANIYPHYTSSPFLINGGYYPGAGSTVPISIASQGGSVATTYGLGRNYGIAEVSLVFMAAKIDISTLAAGTPDPNNDDMPGGNPPSVSNPRSHLSRMSIGPGLPWAVEIDNTQMNDPSVFGLTHPAQYYAWDVGTRAATPYSTFDPTMNKSTVTIGDPQTTAIQAFLLVRPYSTMVGNPSFGPNIRIRISHLDQLQVNCPWANTGPRSLNFPSTSDGAVAVINGGGFAESTPEGGLFEPVIGHETSDKFDPTMSDSGRLSRNNNVHCNDYTLPLPWLNDGSKPSTLLSPTPNYNYPFEGTVTGITNALTSKPVPAYPSPFGGQDPCPFPPGGGTYGIPNGVQLKPAAVMPPTASMIHYAYNPSNSPTYYAGNTMNINGAQIQIDVLDGTTANVNQAQVLESLQVNIPSMTLPIPTVEMANGVPYCGNEGEAFGNPGNNQSGPRIPGYTVGSSNPFIGTPNPNPAYTQPPPTPPPQNYVPVVINAGPPVNYYWQLPYDARNLMLRFANGSDRLINRGDVVRSFVINPASKVAGDMRMLAANPMQKNLNYSADAGAVNIFSPLGNALAGYPTNSTIGSYTSPFIKQLHTLITEDGDNRYGPNFILTSQDFLAGTKPTAVYPNNPGGKPIGDLSLAAFSGGMNQTAGPLFPGYHYAFVTSPAVTPELTGAYMDPVTKTVPGDWSIGIGNDPDGGFVTKADEGESQTGYSSPYYSVNVGNQDFAFQNLSYSPNRQVPSAIMFGTLPSRVMQGVPWCTLLFCPNPAANDNGSTTLALVHPGFGAGAGVPGPTDYPPYTVPPDHLWLDLFWMPVVEPYAISEPFSTAGKVNMNYEIVPFGSYIHRSTALHAVMKSTRILAISSKFNDVNFPGDPSAKSTYNNVTNSNPSYSMRYGINLTATIDDAASAFQVRFKNLKDIFRSATEICNVFLVPQQVPGSVYNPVDKAVPTDASYSSMQNWWSNFQLTGDNGRKSPYSQIYPRLTTKSNTFDVHMRVQVLTQTPADRAAGTFNTTSGDSVIGEYRGSSIVERYLDPNQTTLPDFATTFPANPSSATSTVDNYVRYRIVSTHTFAP